MIRLCGHVLLWVGFLLGAFVAVRKAEVKEVPVKEVPKSPMVPMQDKAEVKEVPWSTISWPSYAAALSVALVGVVILRVTKRSMGAVSETGTGAIDELVSILKRLHKTLSEWNVTATKVPVYDFHGMIDQQLAEDLGRFAELREALIGEFGLDCYAQIMTEFALAERTINRTWSASADGYADEVQICLTRAVAHLSAARQRLDNAIQDRDRDAS